MKVLMTNELEIGRNQFFTRLTAQNIGYNLVCTECINLAQINVAPRTK